MRMHARTWLAMDKFGKVDILINGAAGNFLAEAGTSLTPRGFQTVLDIDARGTYNEIVIVAKMQCLY